MLRSLPRFVKVLFAVIIVACNAPILRGSEISIFSLYKDGVAGAWYEALYVPGAALMVLVALITVIEARASANYQTERPPVSCTH